MIALIAGGLGLARQHVWREIVAMTPHILTLHGVFIQLVSIAHCSITKNKNNLS